MIIPIAVSTIALNLLGFFWYSPSGFGKKWAGYAFPGKKLSDIGGGSSSVYVTAVLCQVVVSFCLYYLLHVYMGIQTVQQALYIGGLLSALVFASQLNHAGFHKKKIGHVTVDQGYDAACILLASAIIVILA